MLSVFEGLFRSFFHVLGFAGIYISVFNIITNINIVDPGGTRIFDLIFLIIDVTNVWFPTLRYKPIVDRYIKYSNKLSISLLSLDNIDQ